MNEQDINKTTAAAPETKDSATAAQQQLQPKRPTEARRFVWLAVFSIILTIAAWIAGSFNGYAAIAISAAAIVVGALALKSHRHSVRNTAITSIIAAAVLLVVVAAFLIVIYVGMKSV